MTSQAPLTIPSALLLAVLLAACGTPRGQAPAAPDVLLPPAGEQLKSVMPATGVQLYTCSAVKDDPSRWEWAFTGPEAELFDGGGRKIGRHYGGPTWEAEDGSKVVGGVKARHDSNDAGAIPWLLLTGRSSGDSGTFGGVTHIQRLATVGGKAPVGGCDASRQGQVSRVPYKATYYFYAPAR
ncbi:DUF3455 domain-containing protein [Aquabacterium sp. A7-Y]|uniref:DUF3455 domain-containing protein n=1 Tax=Aquabacterium sp. A7-Y TaxID=1349605 RepID=UPI00223DB437|nr:DUF3455 domain-containing protein [Aquabacterium sp. A7-Y]MCW7537912.1 DUF3455 domain-containing protein [Aquabacterium sp. A7-Y]